LINAERAQLKNAIINLVVFHIGWFACILGAGNGYPWVGPVVVAAIVFGYLYSYQFAKWSIKLFLISLLIGWGADALVVYAGALGFPESAKLGSPVPIWMPFMWMNFATTLHQSLGWMKERYLIGSLFGLIGGPLAYFTGMKLGAVELGDPFWYSMLVIGIEWSVAMVLLLLVACRFGPESGCENLDISSHETQGES
jgi:Protein of unknown function (DUF2878)